MFAAAGEAPVVFADELIDHVKSKIARFKAPKQVRFEELPKTGTGKTYVYLRSIFELSRRYGFQKFIIVVPSVAIREGVLKNIEITAEHFRALYNNLPFEQFVYDAKKVNRRRQFATSKIGRAHV